MIQSRILSLYLCLFIKKYCIKQIAHGGKLLRLRCLVAVREKTFVVVLFVLFFLTSFMKNLLEKF